MESLRKILARLLKLKKEAQQENSTLTLKKVKAELETIKTEIRQKIDEATELSIAIDCTSPEGKKQFKDVCKELKDLFEIDSLLERQIEEYLVNHSLEEKNKTISASLIRKIEGPFTRLLNKKLEIEELNNQLNINEKETNQLPIKSDNAVTKSNKLDNLGQGLNPITDKVPSQEAIQAMLLSNTNYDNQLRECLLYTIKSYAQEIEKYAAKKLSPFVTPNALDFLSPNTLDNVLLNPDPSGLGEERAKQLKKDFYDAAKRLNLEDKPKYFKQVLIEWFRLTQGGTIPLKEAARNYKKRLLPPNDDKNTDKGPQLVLQNPTKGQRKEQHPLQQDVKLVPPQIGGFVDQTHTKPFIIDLSESGLVTGSSHENDLPFFTWGSKHGDPDQKLRWTIEINPLEANQNLSFITIVPGMQVDEQRSKNAFLTIPGATDYQPDLQTLFEPNKQPLEVVQPIYPDNIIPNLDEGTSVLPQQYTHLVVMPQMNATLLINQGQTGQIISFSTLQQQNIGIFAKAAGDGTCRFSSVTLRPQTSFTPKLSFYMGPPTIGSTNSGNLVAFPFKATRVPIIQSSFAKAVGVYMWTRAAFSVANEIGQANGGYQSWSTTGKNLGYIGAGITVGLAISWAAPPVALVLGCGVIAHDAYRFFNPIHPKIKLHKVSLPPLDPGGLMSFSGPLVNKLEKPVTVETLHRITYSSIKPIGKPQICLDLTQSLATRATKLLQQSESKEASNLNSRTPFYFSYEIKAFPHGTSQIRLEYKTAHHQLFPYITNTSFSQENPKPFVMKFSEQQSYPGYIKVIYPHPQSKKPYVVMIDVAKQSMGINYHHTNPNENITAYIARTVVPESWLKWKVDTAMVVTIDYRNSYTKPNITVEKSGMEICQPVTDLFNYTLHQNRKSMGVKTKNDLLKSKPFDSPMILSTK